MTVIPKRSRVRSAKFTCRCGRILSVKIPKDDVSDRGAFRACRCGRSWIVSVNQGERDQTPVSVHILEDRSEAVEEMKRNPNPYKLRIRRRQRQNFA